MSRRTAGWVAVAGCAGLILGYALGAIPLLSYSQRELPDVSRPVLRLERYRQLVSTRTFLGPKERQQTGFGLYTYILFRKHPTNKEARSRYREALRSFLSLESVREFATATPRQRELLNLTGIPVWSLKGNLAINRQNADPLLDWLVDREYRYSGAERLLSTIPEAGGLGPFILSTHEALSDESPTRPTRYVVQALSWVPARLVSLWMDEFLRAAEKEQEWGLGSSRFLVLNLRTSIGVLAEGLPEVIEAAKQFGSVEKALAESITVRGDEEVEKPNP